MSISEMRAQGLSIREIARRSGHKESIVWGELQRLGLIKRSKSEAAYHGHLQRKYTKAKEEQWLVAELTKQ